MVAGEVLAVPAARCVQKGRHAGILALPRLTPAQRVQAAPATISDLMVCIASPAHGRNSLMKALISAALAICLSGCITIGHKFDPAGADRLTPGTSTMSDAIAVLGPTTAMSAGPNGSTLLQWQYSQGTLVGGSGAHLAILFDADGKMIRVTHRFNLKN